jgi:hypothetical protein
MYKISRHYLKCIEIQAQYISTSIESTSLCTTVSNAPTTRESLLLTIDLRASIRRCARGGASIRSPAALPIMWNRSTSTTRRLRAGRSRRISAVPAARFPGIITCAPCFRQLHAKLSELGVHRERAVRIRRVRRIGGAVRPAHHREVAGKIEAAALPGRGLPDIAVRARESEGPMGRVYGCAAGECG